jgi:hypothetical protein
MAFLWTADRPVDGAAPGQLAAALLVEALEDDELPDDEPLDEEPLDEELLDEALLAAGSFVDELPADSLAEELDRLSVR